MSKADVQKFLYERARNKVGLLKLRAMYKAENRPDWVDQTTARRCARSSASRRTSRSW